jgi:hypothetical protein
MPPIGFDQLGFFLTPIEDVFAAIGKLAPWGKIQERRD